MDIITTGEKCGLNAVFLDYASLAPSDLDISQLLIELPELDFRDKTSQKQVNACVKNADIIFTNKVVIDSDTLRAAKRLKLICSAATGFNHIDVASATDLNIPVCNVRDYANDSVAEHVFALILNLRRSIAAYQGYVRSGEWSRSESFCGLSHPVRELKGATLGIVGYGALGKSTAKLAHCFGMNTLIAQRPGSTLQGSVKQQPERVTLDELLKRSDVISLHCPLNEQTRNLIGAKEFKKMKSTAIIINTARGGIIDESELLNALNSAEIAGAGVDVLEQEPPSTSSILPGQQLPNLLVTPHIAWASQKARQNVIDQLVEMIRGWRQGDFYNHIILK